MPTDPLERILQRISIDEHGCWLWPGATIKGHGVLGTGSRTDGSRSTVYVHRVVYERLVGPILDQLDHVWDAGCRSKNCCNPDHLEDVTSAENTRRWFKHTDRTWSRRKILV